MGRPKIPYPCRGCHLSEEIVIGTYRNEKGKKEYRKLWTCSRNGKSFKEIDQTTSCSDNPLHEQESEYVSLTV